MEQIHSAPCRDDLGDTEELKDLIALQSVTDTWQLSHQCGTEELDPCFELTGWLKHTSNSGEVGPYFPQERN